MFGSAVIGTAIGLVLLFALTALLCSGVTEAISNYLQLRAKYLINGLRALLDEPEPKVTTTAGRKPKQKKLDLHRAVRDSSTTKHAAALVRARVADGTTALRATDAPADSKPESQADVIRDSPFTIAFFDSPLVMAMQTRRVGSRQLRIPQYISAQTFRRALFDTLLPDTTRPGEDRDVLNALVDATNRLPDGHLRDTLKAFLKQSQNKITNVETALEKWYDDQMDRVSGWYKRWSRLVLGIVGLVAAILVNIDTVQVAHALYVDAPIREAVTASANAGALCQGEATAEERTACAKQELAKLDATGLPLGYPSGCGVGTHMARCWSWSTTAALHWWDFPLKLAGWLLTALAVSFGAPFWFDALSKLGSLRNAGPKPQPTPAAATP